MELFFIIILIFDFFLFLSLVSWFALAILPSQPYRYAEKFEIGEEGTHTDSLPSQPERKLPCVTVLIPARNEEEILPETLPSVLSQDYSPLEVILIDDHSTDHTQKVAEDIRGHAPKGSILSIVQGKPLEEGWAGKLWALRQGLAYARGEWILFTDADIYYAPGLLSKLVSYALSHDQSMVSLMAHLRTETFWEKLLIPAFLFFFKALYPFKAVNNPSSTTAAAAGGCVLIRKDALEKSGGLEAVRGALIDDVSLARVVKGHGFPITLMVCPNLLSKRGYDHFGDIWNMVSRSAFTELKYSYFRLIGCVIAMLTAFLIPFLAFPIALYHPTMADIRPPWIITLAGAGAYLLMCYIYAPTIRYFKLSIFYTFSLPVAGLLYLGMTLDSALKYTFGIRARWKGRQYKH